MKKYKYLVFSLLILVIAFPLDRIQASPPPGFQTSTVISSGLDEPSGFEFAPDGRIFILQRSGNVRVYKNGQLLSQPFVSLPSINTGDRGLIGIAFDPNFNSNHFVYFYYTGLDKLNRLVRFDASGDVAVAPAFILYQTSSPSEQLHVGGSIRFDASGKLYFAVGDNGYPPNSQNLSNPHGKILRINKDGTIPTDNPFYGQSGKEWAIWAYGFRNPWRFQFDSLTGDLYVGDVGQENWEEINRVEKGKNYGWPNCEGSCNNPSYVNPVYAYHHDGEGAAVTGGPVYRDDAFSSNYYGSYFFGDYAKGFIKRLTFDQNKNLSGDFDFDTNAGSVVDIKVAGDGSLYYLTIFPGRLYRVFQNDTTTNNPPVAIATANQLGNSVPLQVELRGNQSYDPDGDDITYHWDLGDGNSVNNDGANHIYSNPGTYIAQLSVSDGTNETLATPLVIQVGTVPTVTIGQPQDNSTFTAGDEIFYTVSAVDGAGFDVNDNKISTKIVFHHDEHIHPYAGPFVGRVGSFVTTDHGETDPDVWYEIIATATDNNGVSGTDSVNIFPLKSNIIINTFPSGLGFKLNGIPFTSPQTFQTLENFKHEISVVSPQTLNSKTYNFTGWSDGGSQTHNITVPVADRTYTATFEESGSSPDPDPSPNPGPTTNGLNAVYFNNKDFSGNSITRTDPNINFNWGGASPDGSIDNETFSARWTGKIIPKYSESYTFIADTDDGVRLWIDGQQIIDDWLDKQDSISQGVINLEANRAYDIKLEYFDSFIDAFAILSWQSNSQQKQIIPNSVLFTGDVMIPDPTPRPTPVPSDPPQPPPTGTNGLNAQYFNNMDFSGSSIQRIDNQINFDWDENRPDPIIDSETYSVRWTGKVASKYSELYTFIANTDDGVRVWVNGQLIIDAWYDKGDDSPVSGSINLVAGQKYDIKVEYFERWVEAQAILSWKSSSQSEGVVPSSYLFTN